MCSRLKTLLLGLVHRDEALAEALVSQLSIFAFDPNSATAHDLDRIARQLGQMIDNLNPCTSGICRQG